MRVFLLIIALTGCRVNHSMDEETITVEGKVKTEHDINLHLRPCQTDACPTGDPGYDKKCVDTFLEIWQQSLKNSACIDGL